MLEAIAGRRRRRRASTSTGRRTRTTRSGSWASATASTRTSTRAPRIIKARRGHGPRPSSGTRRPAARHRAGARGGRAQRPVLHRAQALPERRLLQRPHLPGARLPDQDVHGPVRHRPAAGLDRPLARDDDATRRRGSAGRASSTSARRSGPTWRSRTAEHRRDGRARYVAGRSSSGGGAAATRRPYSCVTPKQRPFFSNTSAM